MKRTTRLASLILCLVLLIGSAVGLAASATDASATAEISYTNIEYGDKMYMSFMVSGTDLPEKVGIAAYATSDTTLAPVHTTFEKKVDSKNNEYYASLGIAAQEISTVYYYAVVTENADGEIVVLSEVLPYSVAQYVEDRKDDEGVTAAQAHLYDMIIKYGQAADGVFDAE